MGAFISWLRGKKTKTPIPGFGMRIRNVLKNNFRGLFGVILALACSQSRYLEHSLTVQSMWVQMLFFFLLQPVAIPVTAFIPIFLLPLCGVMDSDTVCACYINENIAFMFLGGLLHLLLNNSGFDRRLIHIILYSKSPKAYSSKKLLIKSSLAAFIASIVSNRHLVTAYIIDIFGPHMMELQKKTSRDSDADFHGFRDILCMAIQTSSVFGSLVFFHASFGLMAFRSMYDCLNTKDVTSDVLSSNTEKFNYTQYVAFSVPLAVVLYLVNLMYCMLLLNVFLDLMLFQIPFFVLFFVGLRAIIAILTVFTLYGFAVVGGGKNKLSEWSQGQIKLKLEDKKKILPPKLTLHEALTVFFYMGFIAVLMTRHAEKWYFGWSLLYERSKGGIKDCSVAAIFVVILSILPKGYSFISLFSAKKKSQISMKPESSIMFWRFVNMYSNYGYIFLLGSGVALLKAVYSTGLSTYLGKTLEPLAKNEYNVTLFISCLFISLLSNIMPSVPALIILYPAIHSMIQSAEKVNTNSYLKLHLYCLAMGIGCNFTFCVPFQNSPARYCRVIGNMSIINMIKFGIVSVIISALILFVFLAFFAPLLFKDTALTPEPITTTTPAATVAL